MPVSEQTYELVALEDPEGQWELFCGSLRRRPGMTTEHSHVIDELARILYMQLNGRDVKISVGLARLRISPGTYYIPDLCVIPRSLEDQKLEEASSGLEVYEEPMPLVVEVWSLSTGDYDVEVKLREYQRRGDLEIWRIHPFERTLTAWIRQARGTYLETLYRGGAVHPVALAGVTMDLEDLFPQRPGNRRG